MYYQNKLKNKLNFSKFDLLGISNRMYQIVDKNSILIKSINLREEFKEYLLSIGYVCIDGDYVYKNKEE